MVAEIIAPSMATHAPKQPFMNVSRAEIVINKNGQIMHISMILTLFFRPLAQKAINFAD